MSSPEIKVTFSALSTAQTDVAATAGRIRTQLEDLKKFLAPMVSTWSGQAAEDYQATQRKWDTSANDLAQVLAQIGTALGAAHDNYRQTEQANAAWCAFRSWLCAREGEWQPDVDVYRVLEVTQKYTGFCPDPAKETL